MSKAGGVRVTVDEGIPREYGVQEPSIMGGGSFLVARGWWCCESVSLVALGGESTANMFHPAQVPVVVDRISHSSVRGGGLLVGWMVGNPDTQRERVSGCGLI